MKSRILTVVAVLLGALAAGIAPAQAAPLDGGYAWPANSVVAVLFVPTEWDVASPEVQDDAAALRSALPEIRQFYADNNGGRTFTVSDLQVVQGRGPMSTYGLSHNGRNIYTDGVDIGPSFMSAVTGELDQRGFPTPPAQDRSGYSTLIWVKGAGGYAGGLAFHAPYVGGWAVLGDWAIDSIAGRVPEGAYWWSGRRLQIGSSAHELGHSFDLPHPDAYGGDFASTVMGNWWDFPTIGLDDTDRQRLHDLRADFFS